MRRRSNAEWAKTLTLDMRERITAIMDSRRATRWEQEGQRDGFTVYMYPTIGTPVYVELRWRDIQGVIRKRWVIHQ